MKTSTLAITLKGVRHLFRMGDNVEGVKDMLRAAGFQQFKHDRFALHHPADTHGTIEPIASAEIYLDCDPDHLRSFLDSLGKPKLEKTMERAFSEWFSERPAWRDVYHDVFEAGWNARGSNA